jgi:hypothetical protein
VRVGQSYRDFRLTGSSSLGRCCSLSPGSHSPQPSLKMQWRLWRSSS